MGLLGNKSPDLNGFVFVTPKPENSVRLQATLGNQNPAGLPAGTVRERHIKANRCCYDTFLCCNDFKKRKE